MAWSYSIDVSSKTVFVTFSGRSSMDEAITMREKLSSDPLFRSSHNELVDLGRLTSSTSDFNDFRDRGSHSDPFSAASHRAIIAPTDFSYGMARMYAVVREKEGVFRVFRSVQPACEWLGLNEEKVQRLLRFHDYAADG